jgi:hypothetical protein
VDRHLRHALHLGRGPDAEQVEHRRRQVDDVMVLVTERPTITDAGRPVDDQRIANAAAVDVCLVPLQRRVASLSPTDRVVGVRRLVAEPVKRLQGFRQRLGPAGLELQVDVDAAEPAALAAGPVIRDQHQQGVVKLPNLFQVRHQPPDLGIGVLQEAGVRLHVPRGDPLLVG